MTSRTSPFASWSGCSTTSDGGAAFALSALPPALRDAVIAAFEAGRFARRRLGLVPKPGARTLGVDLFA
ncbi:MAG: hypothetical protein HY703_11975 [Gemmatimonadetes bacterium]|nr:hypothetical protein [Gemmatimonadota bacterium]